MKVEETKDTKKGEIGVISQNNNGKSLKDPPIGRQNFLEHTSNFSKVSELRVKPKFWLFGTLSIRKMSFKRVIIWLDETQSQFIWLNLIKWDQSRSYSRTSIVMPQCPITRSRAKKLQQTLILHGWSLVGSTKDLKGYCSLYVHASRASRRSCIKFTQTSFAMNLSASQVSFILERLQISRSWNVFLKFGLKALHCLVFIFF